MGRIIIKDEIRSHVLKVLSGYCFTERKPNFPKISILSPWISDVQLEINREILKSDELFFGLDYGILSINLPYALLALRLDFGADITLVTRPPTKKNYDNPSPHRELLDFLDEIGCNVYINPDLHSKLILSNDLALVGSFNLTIPALSGREEIGVCIDDISNLKVLENYAYGVVAISRIHGYSAQNLSYLKSRSTTSNLTRGLLFEEIVRADFQLRGLDYDPYETHQEFIFFYFKTIYTQDVMKKVASDLETFYTNSLLAFLNSKSHSRQQRLRFLRQRFNYQGKHEVDEISDFLYTLLARDHIPKISPNIFSAGHSNNVRFNKNRIS